MKEGLGYNPAAAGETSPTPHIPPHPHPHTHCYMETLQGLRDTISSSWFVLNEVSHSIDQAGLELPAILLCHLPKYWN